MSCTDVDGENQHNPTSLVRASRVLVEKKPIRINRFEGMDIEDDNFGVPKIFLTSTFRNETLSFYHAGPNALLAGGAHAQRFNPCLTSYVT